MLRITTLLRALLAIVITAGAAVPVIAQDEMDDDADYAKCFRWAIVKFQADGTVRCRCSCAPLAPYCCS